MTNQWIPVAEYLPTLGQSVLTYDVKGRFKVLWIEEIRTTETPHGSDQSVDWLSPANDYAHQGITHWCLIVGPKTNEQ